jgi:hypothetical protein
VTRASIVLGAALLTSCWWRPTPPGPDPGGWTWHREITPDLAAEIVCTRERAFVRHRRGFVRWDGASWASLPEREEPTRGGALAATPGGRVLVSSGEGFAEWNGSEWIDHPIASSTGGTAGIVAPGEREAYAIGRGRIARFDGDGWTEHASPSWVELRSVTMAGDDLLVAGQGGTIMRFHDGAWSRETTSITAMVDHVVAFAGDDVWAAAWSWGDPGERPSAIALHHDGATWSCEAEGLPASPLEAIGGGPGDVYAVTRQLLLRFDGSRWSRVAVPADGAQSPQGFRGVCATDRHVLVLDGAGHALVRAR